MDGTPEISLPWTVIDVAPVTTTVATEPGEIGLPLDMIPLAPDTTMVVGEGGDLGADAGQRFLRAAVTAASATDRVITECKGDSPAIAHDVACARVTAVGVGAGGVGEGGTGGFGVGGTGVGAGGVGVGVPA